MIYIERYWVHVAAAELIILLQFSAQIMIILVIATQLYSVPIWVQVAINEYHASIAMQACRWSDTSSIWYPRGQVLFHQWFCTCNIVGECYPQGTISPVICYQWIQNLGRYLFTATAQCAQLFPAWFPQTTEFPKQQWWEISCSCYLLACSSKWCLRV